MDYYGFPPELYQLKFISRGDAALSKRVVELYKEVGSHLKRLRIIWGFCFFLAKGENCDCLARVSGENNAKVRSPR